MDELNQMIWAYMGFWNVLRGLSPPLGVLVAGSGVLLLSGAKGPTVWKYGIGCWDGSSFFLASTDRAGPRTPRDRRQASVG